MNLEQRLAAVEAELAEMKLQRNTTVEISKLMREVTAETIKNAQRPGGLLHKTGEKAADVKTAVDISPAAIKNGETFIQNAFIASALETLQAAKPVRDQ